MAGKNYCTVEHKWCKLLKKGICARTNSFLDSVKRCPRMIEIETIRFYDILREVTFKDSFERLVYWFGDQEKSREKYEEVFNILLHKKVKKHHYVNDLYIGIDRVIEDGTEYVDVYGIAPGKSKRWGIEFCPWQDWVSMFITQETLDNFTKEEIVGACLYEMTFDGFSENAIKEQLNKIRKSFEEMKQQ